MGGGFAIHAAFDVLAWIAAGAAGLWLMRSGRVSFPVPQPLRFSYLAVLIFGAGLGAVAFGSANLWLSGQSGFARSIEGAVAGAIVNGRTKRLRDGVSLDRRPVCWFPACARSISSIVRSTNPSRNTGRPRFGSRAALWPAECFG